MVWTVKQQNSDNSLISYSFEQNEQCDGLISYDKQSDKLEIKRLSSGADDFDTKRLFPHLHRLIDKNTLSDKPYRIVTG